MIERHLAPLVVATTVLGLLVPALGVALRWAVTPLLALLMLSVSLTFDLPTLRAVLQRPGAQALATLLVYGPMSLAAFAIATVLFDTGPLWLGVILIGVLPTDVSSPLLVLIARGDAALATVFNAVNTALAPVLVPALFLLYTGVELDVPVALLTAELAATVLLPTAVGVAVRTWKPHRVAPLEPVLSATGSLAYLALLLTVVGQNADAVLDQPATVALVSAAALALNVTGYLVASLARPLMTAASDLTTLLFTVSKKEFSIAAFVVMATGLPAEVALPAAVYAVVQMLTSPLVASRLGARAA